MNHQFAPGVIDGPYKKYKAKQLLYVFVAASLTIVMSSISILLIIGLR